MYRSSLNRRIAPAATDSYTSNVERTTETKKTEKKKFTLFKSAIIKDYLANTSLNGLNFVGSTNITFFERIFFGFAFLLVLFCSIYFILEIYIRWSKTPVIFSFATNNTMIRNLPFPAVTICNQNNARKSVVHKMAHGSTENVMLKSICYGEYANITINDTKDENIEWNRMRQYLLDVSQPCEEMLHSCRFGTETINCMSLFDTVLTDEGICCTFNLVEAEFFYRNPLIAPINLDNYTFDPRMIPVDWTPQTGYVNQSIKEISIPRPASGAGRRMGLHLVLNANVSDYYCSSTNTVGFKVLLHNPVVMPKIRYFGMLLHPGRETEVVITPKIGITSDRARKVPVAIRECFFEDEFQMKFYRTYSQKNCDMECFSQAMEEECGCVMYYMPRLNRNSRICTRASFNCYNPLLISLERAENSKYKCACYWACNSLSYSGVVSTTPLLPPLNSKSSLSNFSAESRMNDIAVVDIFYTSYSFETFVRDEFIGLTEFLSHTGGLLCLFLGFSAVSLVEIFYFIALRSYCSRHTNQDNLETQQHIHKSKYKSRVSKLSMKNQIQPYTRIHGRTHLDSYANNQTMNQVVHRKKY